MASRWQSPRGVRVCRVSLADGAGPASTKPAAKDCCRTGWPPQASSGGIASGGIVRFPRHPVSRAKASPWRRSFPRPWPGRPTYNSAPHPRSKKRNDCGVDLHWNTPVARLADISARWIVGADGIGSRVKSLGRAGSFYTRQAALRFPSAFPHCALDRLRGDLLGRRLPGICHARFAR